MHHPDTQNITRYLPLMLEICTSIFRSMRWWVLAQGESMQGEEGGEGRGENLSLHGRRCSP